MAREEKFLFGQIRLDDRYPDRVRVLAGCGWAYYTTAVDPTLAILDEGTMADFLSEEDLLDTPVFTFKFFVSSQERDAYLQEKKLEIEKLTGTSPE